MPNLFTPPVEMPITLAEAKLQCRVEHGDDDAYIESLIAAATGYFDGYHGILARSIIAQTWREIYLEQVGVSEIALPFADINSIAIDLGNLPLSATDFKLRNRNGVFYCIFTEPQTGDLTVYMECGFGDASKVPANLKHCIKILISTWYYSRENIEFVSGASAKELPYSVRNLYMPFKLNLVT